MGLNQSGSTLGRDLDRLGRVVDGQLDFLKGQVLKLHEAANQSGDSSLNSMVSGRSTLVPAQETAEPTPATACPGLGFDGRYGTSALITSPGFKPALAAGESGRTADDMGADRIAETQPRDIDRLVRPAERTRSWGACRRASRSGFASCRLAGAGVALDLEGHRLAGLAKQRPGKLQRVEIVSPVDLDDPVSLAESGRFRGRVFADCR